MKKLIYVLLGCSILQYTFATEKPLPLASDARIQIVAYTPNNVVPIHGASMITTQITLNPKESIQNVQNGDLGAWTTSINKTAPYMLFIKPTVYGSNTNMTVVTDQRTYYFHLISHKNKMDDAKLTYAIHFIYPEEETEKMQRTLQDTRLQLSPFQHPDHYHWDYSFHGDKSIVPLHVFDDGHFTYMQLQRHQALPAVFVVDNPAGKESVVNFREQGRYLVVQRVAPQFTLRLGATHVASIFNNALIRHEKKA